MRRHSATGRLWWVWGAGPNEPAALYSSRATVVGAGGRDVRACGAIQQRWTRCRSKVGGAAGGAAGGQIRAAHRRHTVSWWAAGGLGGGLATGGPPALRPTDANPCLLHCTRSSKSVTSRSMAVVNATLQSGGKRQTSPPAASSFRMRPPCGHGPGAASRACWTRSARDNAHRNKARPRWRRDGRGQGPAATATSCARSESSTGRLG